jgi:hypothetical protein
VNGCASDPRRGTPKLAIEGDEVSTPSDLDRAAVDESQKGRGCRRC